MSEMVHKVTLDTKKVVLLRDFKIKHQKLAAQAASQAAGGDVTLLSMFMADEILKILIFQVDGKQPAKADLEDLDSLFTNAEYNQLLLVVQQFQGGDVQAPKTEFVSSGK